jgi:hypothetical protein
VSRTSEGRGLPHPEYGRQLRQIHGKYGEIGKLVADLWRKSFTNQTFALDFLH